MAQIHLPRPPIYERIHMVTTSIDFKPSNELLDLLRSKGLELQMDSFENIGTDTGTLQAVNFNVKLPDGRIAQFSSHRRDYDDAGITGYTAGVMDLHDEDSTIWDNIDAIGFDFNSAFYSAVNQFNP